MNRFSPEFEPYSGWHPLRVFRQIFWEGVPHWCIYSLAVVGVFAFLWRTFHPRFRSETFLSPTILFAVLPFVIFSWRCYYFAQFVPWAIEQNQHLSDINIPFVASQAAYSFQFGTVVSSALLMLHFIRVMVFRQTRK